MKKFFAKILLVILTAALVFVSSKAMLFVCFAETSTSEGNKFSDTANTQSVVTDYIKTFSNAILPVSFSSKGEFKDDFYNITERTYTTSPESVKNYFLQASLNKFSPESCFVTKNASLLDGDESYYTPKYKYAFNDYRIINENGYDNRFFDENGNPCNPSKSGAKQHIDRFLCEQKMVRRAVSTAKENGFLQDIEIDSDNDGRVDNLTLIFNVNSDITDWEDIFWPHRSSLTFYSEAEIKANFYLPDDYDKDLYSVTALAPVYVNGKVVTDYIIFTSYSLASKKITDSNRQTIYNVGTICHEMMHILNVSDYYHYNTGGADAVDEPVGELDIMSSVTAIPQMPLSYTRYNLGWLTDENIMPVESSGTYKLYPTTSDNVIKALKLVPDEYPEIGEYFMIEARTNSGSFIDSLLSGSGITVYRINEKNGFVGIDGNQSIYNYGNMYGGDEVYVYRLGNKVITESFGVTTSNYALLDGTTRYYNKTIKGYVDKSTIGNPDKSADRSVIATGGRLMTSLFYEAEGYEGINSGVYIHDIKRTTDGAYEFEVEFETAEKSSVSASISKYYNLKNITANWSIDSRIGNVDIYMYGAEGYLKYKNGNYILSEKITPEMLEEGNLYGNKLNGHLSVPASYCRAFLPETTEKTAVFLCYTDSTGVRKVMLCGIVKPDSPTFLQYLLGTDKWLILIIGIVVVFSVIIVVGIIFMVKKEKSYHSDDTEEDLTSVYGENYWEVDEAENIDTIEEDILTEEDATIDNN